MYGSIPHVGGQHLGLQLEQAVTPSVSLLGSLSGIETRRESMQLCVVEYGGKS